MAKFELDHRAAQAIDERGIEILNAVGQLRTEPTAQAWAPDVALAAKLTREDIIGRIDIARVDPSGVRVAVEFSHDGKKYGLDGREYKAVSTIVAAFLKNREIRTRISKDTIEDLVRTWIVRRHIGEIDESLSAYVCSQSESQIFKFRVWIPIEQLHIQRSFQLGLAEICEFSADLVTNIITQAKTEDARVRAENEYKRYQGHAAVVVTWEGDRAKAREMALQIAENALGALSLLSPAALHCEVSSAASFWGSKRIRQAASVFFIDEKMAGSTKGLLGTPPQSQILDNTRIDEFAPILRGLHWILMADSSMPLSIKIVDALKVYYRGISSNDPAEKLIYVFVALEMILLRDSSEAIQENIATRIAFLVGRSIEERRSIVFNVKAGYSLRSAFVHHGVQVEDVASANEFLLIAWHTFVQLLAAARQYPDPADLIRALDDRKLQ